MPAHPDAVRLVIHGHHPRGQSCGSYSNIHVGVQVRSEPAELVRADAEHAEWTLDLTTRAG
jgi:hypothetical protein